MDTHRAPGAVAQATPASPSFRARPSFRRRGGLEEGLPEVAGSAIVLVYPPQDRQLAAEAVALYLYLYCNFDVEQAAKVSSRGARHAGR